jgi:hypothetical protein
MKSLHVSTPLFHLICVIQSSHCLFLGYQFKKDGSTRAQAVRGSRA